MIPYGKQDISRRDIDEVIRVLSSDFLTQGPEVPRFEALVSNIVGSKFSVAMNSATSALHCACLALGVQKKRSNLDKSNYICCFSKLRSLLWCKD
jgi:dTDP-4-amino-4,6-dideoxygalactose transaminase